MKGSEKINNLLNYLSLNPSDFAKKLGLKYVQNIYDIQNDRIDVSKSMANKIVSNFPEINYSWLLTGEGEMLKNNNQIANIENNSNTFGFNLKGYGITVTNNDFTEIIDDLYNKIIKTTQEQLSESQKQVSKLLNIIEDINKK